jgi:hypothetical protein
MDIRTPEFVAVGSDAQRVHPDNATSGATFTRTVQPSPEQDIHVPSPSLRNPLPQPLPPPAPILAFPQQSLSRPVEDCEGCPALAGVRHIGLDNPGADSPHLPCNFESLFKDVKTKVFDRFGDETVVYPGHGDDTTLGAKRPSLSEWLERGW